MSESIHTIVQEGNDAFDKTWRKGLWYPVTCSVITLASIVGVFAFSDEGAIAQWSFAFGGVVLVLMFWWIRYARAELAAADARYEAALTALAEAHEPVDDYEELFEE